MMKLPVIVGFGGINAAGRSSGHNSYRRMIIDSLSQDKADQTLVSLGALTGLIRKSGSNWLDSNNQAVELDRFLQTHSAALKRNTLIRQLETNLFDPDHLLFHKRAHLNMAEDAAFQFEMNEKHLPTPLPPGWSVEPATDEGNKKVCVTAHGDLDVLLKCYRKAKVNSAGQLPSGFDPGSLYASRNHPRGLQLTVYAASDAINSIGIDWEVIRQTVAPDQISVYAGSGMSQLDYNGNGGMMQARLLGKKVTSKQLPLGYAEMPADFINAYLLGNLGTTGTNIAACATFLYNLRQGIRDIQSGTHRVVIVGTSEAPLVPEIFDGFATMGALADDASLRALENLQDGDTPDYRRACRPFGFNAGFTLAESAQCIVLMDDTLALELGANMYGAVNDVFINADGHKKSIASPGLGNYLSLAKATAATQNIIGEDGLRHRSFVQSHGTGTLQNRQTESHIISEVAKTFGIEKWPVAAIKSYVGHSLASSAGDQLATTLGVWEEGVIPGILTVDEIADDVYTENVEFLLKHKEVGADGIDATIINSKGFGGNNASASILSPHITRKMLLKRHGADQLKQYQQRNEAVQEESAAYEQASCEGVNSIIYKFDHNVMGSESIEMSSDSISIKNITPEVALDVNNPYEDMCD